MKNPKKNIFLILVAVTTTSLITFQIYAQSNRSGKPPRGPDLFNMQTILEKLDTDADGTITKDEINYYQEAQIQQYDSDGNNEINLEEFSLLWSSRMRESMVNQFQAMDNDGTGQLTVTELNARMDALMKRFDRDGDGTIIISELRRRGESLRSKKDNKPRTNREKNL